MCVCVCGGWGVCVCAGEQVTRHRAPTPTPQQHTDTHTDARSIFQPVECTCARIIRYACPRWSQARDKVRGVTSRYSPSSLYPILLSLSLSVPPPSLSPSASRGRSSGRLAGNDGSQLRAAAAQLSCVARRFFELHLTQNSPLPPTKNNNNNKKQTFAISKSGWKKK